MFTGIVEELGGVARLDRHGAGAVLSVRGPKVCAGSGPGDSIAVNGVCLTVTQVDGDEFTADVMRETLERSALAELAEGEPVNLERPVTPAGRLGGHILQGHVDGVGLILAREPGERWHDVRISLPRQLARYVVEKGSIGVDGVSLTVTEASQRTLDDEREGGPAPYFGVSLIPTTLALTTLGHKDVGASVNLEVDVLAKYVENLLTAVPR